MDNYVKMCMEAGEIQKALKKEFNYAYQGYCLKHKCSIEADYDGVAVCPVFEKKMWKAADIGQDEEDKVTEKEECENTWIGLPTLEQLFSLIRDKYDSDLDMILNFEHFISAYTEVLKVIEKGTAQELLMIFVMWRKYNKIWNEKEKKWVKDKKNEEL